MKFKEKLATMIQGIFKGNPWKFSIFKSTWSLIFDNQHPVFSYWDQWHQRSCHFHVCHTHVDVHEGKILENVTLEVDLNIEIFQELPFNIPWIIIGEFSLNFMLLEPMLLGVREGFFLLIITHCFQWGGQNWKKISLMFFPTLCIYVFQFTRFWIHKPPSLIFD